MFRLSHACRPSPLISVLLLCLLLGPAITWAGQNEQPQDPAPAAANVEQGQEQAEAQPAEPTALELVLGRSHRLVVHFPIALLIVALLIEIFAAVGRKPLPTNAGMVCFAIGAVGAGVAAWFGWIYADAESVASSTLDTHRWLGVGTACLAGLTLLFAMGAKWGSWKAGARLYAFGVICSALVVSVAGHFGGAVVYGHTYVVESFLPEPSVELVASDTEADGAQAAPALEFRAIAFEEHILPILQDTCIECHGPRKKRGSLRLDEAGYVFHDEPLDWIIIPGKPEESEIIRRLELPEQDRKHMPYKRDSLPRVEIERLKLWILEGAVWGDYHPPIPGEGPADEQISIDDMLAEFETTEPALSPEQYTAKLAALEDKGVLASPVSEGTQALDVNASLLGEAFADADLSLFEGIESSVESLNLARSGITDDGAAALSNFTIIRTLHLENTQVGDAALENLSGLTNLQYLNLYNTAVTDAGLESLHGLSNLRKVFLWQTAVTSEGAEALRQAIPGIVVDMGDYATVATAGEEESLAAKLIPDCCAAAEAEGNTCDHACCVEAAAKGEVCQTCLGAGE